MKILVFLEPSIELKNPLFRYPGIKNTIIPQTKRLLAMGHEVVTLLSTPLANKSYEDGINSLLGVIASIEPIDWTRGEDSNQRALRLLNDGATSEELSYIKDLMTAALPHQFSPNLIICWESPAPFLSKVYPEAIIFNQVPGFFSRPPFPALIHMNSGLLSSYVPFQKTNNKIRDVEYADFELYRNSTRTLLKRTSPVQKIIDNAKENFSKVILFPLQIDNYFMIDTIIKPSNQFEVLQNILSNIPQTVGVIVTDYVSNMLSSEVITPPIKDYLEKKFPNLIYDDRLNNTYCVSQFIAPYVDGVITISSSVGLQAAFWKKPLYVLGKSHLSSFSTANSLNNLLTQLDKTFDRDEEIINFIKEENFPLDYDCNTNYFAWLMDKYHGNNKFDWLEGKTVGTWLQEHQREENFLKAIKHTSLILSQESLNCKELSVQIQKHDIISFDIFDTLLVRPFIKPTDLFRFIEDKVNDVIGFPSSDFVRLRVQAEKESFKNALKCDRGETTLHEIYTYVAKYLNISDDMMNKIMEIEIATEKKLLYRRNTGYSAFLEAKDLGKKIVIISDMYLPEVVIIELLEKNGYTGYHDLFLSSTCGVKKHNGELYKFFLNRLTEKDCRILHIGDNLHSDVIEAKNNGIKPFHLPRTINHFMEEKNGIYKKIWKNGEQHHSESWKIILAIMANSYYDNPYVKYKENATFDGNPQILGYYALGPLLLAFAKWICKEASEKKIKKLYFLSREGKIIKAAYDKISHLFPDAPQSIYLHCSRRAVNLAKVKNSYDIIQLAKIPIANNTQLRDLLKNRFGVDPLLIPAEVLKKYKCTLSTKLQPHDLDWLLKLLTNDLLNIILETTNTERKSYLKYLHSHDLYDENTAGIVDIGYAGTMQESLYLLGNKRKKLTGYYIITFRTALARLQEHKLIAQGFYGDYIDRHDTYHPFCKNIPLAEIFFSSSETSFICIKEDSEGNLHKHFLPKIASEEARINVVTDIQEGALDFISKVVDVLGKELIKLDLEPMNVSRAFFKYCTNPKKIDAKLFLGIAFEDKYGGASERYLIAPQELIQTPSIWKEGLLALTAKEIQPIPTLHNKTKHIRLLLYKIKIIKNIFNRGKKLYLEKHPHVPKFNNSLNIDVKMFIYGLPIFNKLFIKL